MTHHNAVMGQDTNLSRPRPRPRHLLQDWNRDRDITSMTMQDWDWDWDIYFKTETETETETLNFLPNRKLFILFAKVVVVCSVHQAIKYQFSIWLCSLFVTRHYSKIHIHYNYKHNEAYRICCSMNANFIVYSIIVYYTTLRT
jgi:hypothetical protein